MIVRKNHLAQACREGKHFMDKQSKVVLNAKLTASLRGDPLDNEYRAVLFMRDGNARKVILGIEEKFGTEWKLTSGQWYLDTLLEQEVPHDKIYIDHGMYQWEISSGMAEAIREAAHECGIEIYQHHAAPSCDADALAYQVAQEMLDVCKHAASKGRSLDNINIDSVIAQAKQDIGATEDEDTGPGM